MSSCRRRPASSEFLKAFACGFAAEVLKALSRQRTADSFLCCATKKRTKETAPYGPGLIAFGFPPSVSDFLVTFCRHKKSLASAA